MATEETDFTNTHDWNEAEGRCLTCGATDCSEPCPIKPETLMDYIDFTPPGLKTSEGQERVTKAQQEWDSAAHEVANLAKEFIFNYGSWLAARYSDSYSDVQALRDAIRTRDGKQEAFLRAVAGK